MAYLSTDVPMGRNCEITDDFTMQKQAAEAIAASRKSATGQPREAKAETGKVVTVPPLTV